MSSTSFLQPAAQQILTPDRKTFYLQIKISNFVRQLYTADSGCVFDGFSCCVQLITLQGKIIDVARWEFISLVK